MTTAITFSRQNDACSCPSNTQYWENLVLVVVLVLSPVQTDATLLANNSQHCCMLHVTCCVRLRTLLRVVAQSLKPVKLLSQQLATFLLFRDRRSVAQQCWICLDSSSNIVGATHAHYAWFTKTYGLYPSHDALQVPTLLELLHPFAHHCQHARNKSQHCWRNNVGSCCVCSHAALESKGLYFNAYVHTITLLLYLCMIIFFSILLQYFLACLWLK